MRSRTPKMLHEICGRPMIDWTVAAALEAGAGKVVVIGSPDGALDGRLPDGVVLTVQPEANGTGGAGGAPGRARHRGGAVRGGERGPAPPWPPAPPAPRPRPRP